MVGSNLGRVLTLLTENYSFYQAVLKCGRIIPLCVLVNAEIMQLFVLEMLIIPTTVLGKLEEYFRPSLKICGYTNQSVYAV
jgi:hypothetical protein